MTNDERKAAIKRFGYTEREAAFLCLAALHGGYFLRRQYNAFLERQCGGNADRLIEQGVFQGHVHVHESANRTQIYHVGAKHWKTSSKSLHSSSSKGNPKETDRSNQSLRK